MIAGLAPEALALAIAAALAAAFVRGLAGFGMAILLVPVLSLAVAPREAVVVGNLLGLFIGFFNLRKQLGVTEKSALPIAGLALLTIPLGMLALGRFDPALARLLIALIALTAFVAVILPRRPAHQPGRAETMLTGAACGLLTGFAAMPGPPVVPYYLRRDLNPQVARASMMTIFLVTQGAGALTAVLFGVATWRELSLAALLYPAVLLGNWLGTLAFGRVGENAWRWFAGAVLGAAALAALLKLLQA